MVVNTSLKQNFKFLYANKVGRNVKKKDYVTVKNDDYKIFYLEDLSNLNSNFILNNYKRYDESLAGVCEKSEENMTKITHKEA